MQQNNADKYCIFLLFSYLLFAYFYNINGQSEEKSINVNILRSKSRQETRVTPGPESPFFGPGPQKPSILPCHQTPQPILQGLTPPSKCQLQKIFHQTKVNYVNYINPNQNTINPIYLKYFPPYNLSKIAQKELNACTLRTYNCQTFPETESTWNMLEENTFKEILKVENLDLHTSDVVDVTSDSQKSQSCHVNNEFKMTLILKNYKNQTKTYGGDFITARLVEETYIDYHNTKNKKYGIFDEELNFINETYRKAPHNTFNKTIIPAHVIDNKNGSYEIVIPCKFVGKFRIQIFIMRTAEMMTAIIHSFKTLNNKSGQRNRFLYAELRNGGVSHYCDSLLPDMLPGGDTAKICPIHNSEISRQWYCYKPHEGSCDNELLKVRSDKANHVKMNQLLGSGKWSLSEIFEKSGLERVYEDLVFEEMVEVLPEVSSSSGISSYSPSHQQIAGYFHNGAWHDRILPNWALPNHKNLTKFLKNKRIIRMGDSITRQMVNFLFNDIRDLLQQEKENSLLEEEMTSKSRPKRFFTNLPLNLQDKFSHNCQSDENLKGSWFSQINLTQNYFNHDLPYFMGAKDICAAKAMYSPEIFDRMIEFGWSGKEYVIIMDHSAHFSNWHPVVLYNRLIALKEAALKYKKFSPETPIIFKTFNYCRGSYEHTKGTTTISGVIPLWQRDIVFKIFGNPYLEDIYSDDEKYPIKVLDVFPMSLAAFDQMEIANVHPLELMAREQGRMFLNVLYRMGWF